MFVKIKSYESYDIKKDQEVIVPIDRIILRNTSDCFSVWIHGVYIPEITQRSNQVNKFFITEQEYRRLENLVMSYGQVETVTDEDEIDTPQYNTLDDIEVSTE